MPDSQSLILFAVALVAGIVCFRLFLVLGRRTGHEPTARSAPAAEKAPSQPATAALEAPRVDASAPSGLVEIQLADRNFDPAHFLSGAREAYGRIVKAFAAGDRAALAPLLSPAVAQAFESAIAARGEAAPAAFNTLHDARIVGASLAGRHAEITVAFRAEFAGQNGPEDVSDVWTFSRDLDSADPNWTLVATSGELPE
jgi:predicted lipid-binding transport protein (Tim44 family)